jgi:plastocyanin
MTKSLGLAALLAALAVLPGSPAQATQRAELTTTGTGTPPAAAPGRAAPPTGAPDRAARPAALTLVARPRDPRVRQHVRLSVIDPPAGAAGYTWDLTGSGVAAGVPGQGAEAQTAFATPGAHAVGVRFTVGDTVRQGVLVLTVQPAPAGGSGRAARSRARSVPRLPPHAAGDPGVTIADFHFTPGATTVHVGDTITWTNNGPSSHTATANNGSFNTGVLKKGQSASHTFTQAGTFSYYCQIHPFMHGTIVVLASTAPTTSTPTQTSAQASAPTTAGSTTAGPTSTAAAAATGTGGQPTLPLTGLDVLSGLAAGLLLIGLGVALRRTLAR